MNNSELWVKASQGEIIRYSIFKDKVGNMILWTGKSFQPFSAQSNEYTGMCLGDDWSFSHIHESSDIFNITEALAKFSLDRVMENLAKEYQAKDGTWFSTNSTDITLREHFNNTELEYPNIFSWIEKDTFDGYTVITVSAYTGEDITMQSIIVR